MADGADGAAPGLLRLACEDLRAPVFIRALVRHGASRSEQGSDGLDVLDWACEQGYWLAAAALCEDPGAQFSQAHARAHGECGKTLAMALAALGAAEPLERLTSQVPTSASTRDEAGFDPFWAACEGGWSACAQVLGPWANPFAPYPDGGSALHAAAKLGSAPLAASLLFRGASPSQPDAQGRQPLHSAAQGGDPDCCAALIEAGADVFARDDEGLQALDLARTHGRSQACAVLEAFMERGRLGAETAPSQAEQERGRL